MNTTDNALTEAERLLLARVNDCTKPIDAADRNGILKLIDRLAACPVEQPASAPIDTPTDREFALAAAICVHPKGVYGDEGGSMCCPITHTRDASFAPSPADEREAFEKVFPMPAHCQRIGHGRTAGYAPTEYGAWEASDFIRRWEGWQAGRAASANETGAEGAAVAWMSIDDPRDCISDAKKRDMIEHAGAPGARLAEKYSIALGVITPAQAAEQVAQWQLRLKDRSSPVVDHWVNISPDGAKTLMEKYANVYEVRALYTAPQPPAQAAEPVAWMVFAANTRQPCEVTLYKSETEALRQDCVVPLYAAPQHPAQTDAREGLTDEQRSTLESLARTSTPYEQEVLRSILAAHPRPQDRPTSDQGEKS